MTWEEIVQGMKTVREGLIEAFPDMIHPNIEFDVIRENETPTVDGLEVVIEGTITALVPIGDQPIKQFSVNCERFGRLGQITTISRVSHDRLWPIPTPSED